MAHMINISESGRANVFVVKEPAWHKLGQVLQNPATAEEAIKEAGLDFIVEKKEMFIANGDGLGSKVPNRFATVRKDTGDVLGVVSDRYNVLQNTEGFQFFDSIVDKDEAIYHSAGVLGKGERVWIMAKLPHHIVVKGIDATELYITLMLGHDGRTPVSSFFHANRIVCNNTLQMALGQAKNLVKFSHDANILANVKDAAQLMGITSQYKADMEGVFTTLSNTKVDKLYTDAFISALFPAIPAEVEEKMIRVPSYKVYRGQVLEAIEAGAGQDMPTTQGTAFGLYNGVTFFLDHLRKGHGNNLSKKQASLWFGDSARIRQRAFDLLSYDGSELKSLVELS